jgi:hypothetical protein
MVNPILGTLTYNLPLEGSVIDFEAMEAEFSENPETL